MRKTHLFLCCSAFFCLQTLLLALDAPAPTAEELLKHVTVADGFQANIFATPDQASHPVFSAAAPDGTLFVSCDSRLPNMGRILRLRDTKGTGHANEIKEFIPHIDSPRGLVWDKDRLYVMHPPHLSVFIDKNNDGIADLEKILVKNIASSCVDRAVDHAANGLSIGVDGWLYIACGDSGFLEAEGTDGKKLQLRGGGVVRVRPDGTGLEPYSQGTGNTPEVALSPLLDGFSRDNANTGDGWDSRLQHFSGLENHGYPRLYKFFPQERIKPLAEYRGGASGGAVWIDEPGFPAKWNNLPYTCARNPEALIRHQVKPKGATFEETDAPIPLVQVPRSTDADVDALSHVYINSWNDGALPFPDNNLGFIIRVSPKGYSTAPLPNFGKLADPDLLKLLTTNSYRRRLESQRELLRRGLTSLAVGSLQSLVTNSETPLASRVLALFTLKQGQGEAAHSFIAEAAADPTIEAWAIRALTDRWDQLSNVPPLPILAGLKSQNPRTRTESVIAIARLGHPELAVHLSPLLVDPDPVVSHSTVESLIRLRSINSTLAILDDPSEPQEMRTGALRVLQVIHEPKVIDALIVRLDGEQNAVRRLAFAQALSRLYYQEGPWKGEPWGSRPDTRGPYYQPEKWSESDRIAEVLLALYNKSTAPEAAALSQEFARHHIKLGAAAGKLVHLAEQNPDIIPTLAWQLAQEDTIPDAALPLLTQAVRDAKQTGFTRAMAIQALLKSDNSKAFDTLIEVLPTFKSTAGSEWDVQNARAAFMSAPKLENFQRRIAELAASDKGEASQWADSVLLNLAKRTTGAAQSRILSAKALEDGWHANPRRRIQIMHAMVSTNAPNQPLEEALALGLEDEEESVRQTAHTTLKTLNLDPDKILGADRPPGPLISTLTGAEVLKRIFHIKGDRRRGEQLFTQQGCVNCHTTAARQPLKGPYLGFVGQTRNRTDLVDAILYPSKTIAQGFGTTVFKLHDGSLQTGFIVQESAETVTIRNGTGQDLTLPIEFITERTTDPKSMMPEGLVDNLHLRDFASLLEYLESLRNDAK